MTHVKKQLAALAVLFTLEFLSLFANGTFAWSNQYTPSLLKAASHTDARAAASATLETPAKTNDGFVLKSYGEPTPRSGILFTAKESPGIFVRSFVASALFFRIILAPKVSRYISKSVLNL